MNILSIIAHAGLLIHCGRDVQNIATNLIQHKEKYPSQTEFLNLVDDTIGFLGAGVLGLPDDVVKQICGALTLVKAELSTPQAPQPAA